MQAYSAWLRGVGGSSHYHPILAILDEIIVVWHDHDAVLLDSNTIIVRMRGFADCVDDFYGYAVNTNETSMPKWACDLVKLRMPRIPTDHLAIKPIFGVQALYLGSVVQPTSGTSLMDTSQIRRDQNPPTSGH